MLLDVLSTFPAVYAVNRSYQIMVPVKKPCLMWCEVGGKNFYDEFGGILKSNVITHRMIVPMTLLDQTCHYKIHYRIMKNHLPYFPETGEEKILEFEFRPIKKSTSIRIFHIADAHNRVASPIASARGAGNLDLLVLNGDIPNHSGDVENFKAIHQIAGEITQGQIPVVFSRGNHDLRGIYAENMGEHTPTDNGNSYYTFRLGPVWGILLDCGEDKPDEHDAYGHVNVCHSFRLRQTEFLRDIIKRKDMEYEAPGVQYRLVISHMPFAQVPSAPFDIEQELYRQWCYLLKSEVKPHLFLAGHKHKLYIIKPGSELDHLGAPCPIVVGSDPGKELNEFAGCAVNLETFGALIQFINHNKRIIGEEFLKF